MSDDEEIPAVVQTLAVESSRQSLSERYAIRQNYQKLINDAQKEKEKEDIDVIHASKVLDEANHLYERIFRPREALLDAKLLNLHSYMIKQKINLIQAGNQFNTAQFVNKIALMIRPVSRNTDCGDNSLSFEDFIELGKRTSMYVNRTPKLNFLYGTFVQPVGTTKVRRRIRDAEEKSKGHEVKAVSANSQKIDSDRTCEEIFRIKNILNIIYKDKGCPLCFFGFIVDPQSFNRTVENIFHFGFLIKDRSARIFIDETGLPVIEPAGGSSGDMYDTASQSVVSLNLKQWKDVVKEFRITCAAIPPSRRTVS